MIDIGVKITQRCNFQCRHCMFSCGSWGKPMNHNTVTHVSRFLRNNTYHNLNIFGGEPFLDVDYFDVCFQKFYNRDIGFTVSTNGSFVNNSKRFEYVKNLCHRYGKTHSCKHSFSIRISNTIFHQEYWTPKMKKTLKNLDYALSNPYDYFDYFDEGTDWETVYGNPFQKSDTEYSFMYIDGVFTGSKSKLFDNPMRHDCMNPSGRAIKTGSYDCESNCYCFLSFKDEDDNIDINIFETGDIGICCNAHSGTIGNIKDFNTVEEVVKERNKFKHQFRKKYTDMDSDALCLDYCEKCRKFKMKKV